MDMLKTKLQLLTDLSYEHKQSLQSLLSVKNGFESLLDHVERQITSRSNDKAHLKTKIGLHLRETILNLFNQVIGPVREGISQIHQAYCQTEQVYTHLLERQLSLEEVIKHGHPLVKQIEHLSDFIHETTHRYAYAKSAVQVEEQALSKARKLHRMISQQQQGLNKQNIRTENSDTKSSRGQQGEKYKLNMLLIARQGSQGFLKASQKLKQFQIMELSLVVDQCLSFVSDTKFIQEKMTSKTKSQPEQLLPEQSISLGIESRQQKSEDIDLLCDEDISFALPMPKKCMSEDLQRITERQEELQSDNSSSRLVDNCAPSL